ncbi:hypothetical protein P618_200850 [Holospora obtusa F1]|uniref:Uncharacterized protein n=1 Tax=Holospora obtusa F1 TaxID=1399147 RepID=W6TT60_HOLOB|nr:hypothetical protein [Holospora obtusa]ETZ06952.1 hypothetical protein P618_200850 [Holospora obtusa F1]
MIIVKHKGHHIEFQLIEVFVKISLCCVVFEDSVDNFDLSVGPRMLEFSKSVFNLMLLAHHIKGVRFVFCPQVLRKRFIGKLRPIVCENFRYFTKTMGDHIFQKCT